MIRYTFHRRCWRFITGALWSWLWSRFAHVNTGPIGVIIIFKYAVAHRPGGTNCIAMHIWQLPIVLLKVISILVGERQMWALQSQSINIVDLVSLAMQPKYGKVNCVCLFLLFKASVSCTIFRPVGTLVFNRSFCNTYLWTVMVSWMVYP